MSSKKERIREKAVDIIRRHPEGIRWANLLREIQKALPDCPKNTISGSTYNLYETHDNIYKPSKGLWKYKADGEDVSDEIITIKPPKSLREESFYKPFAEYIRDDLGECTEAVPLGGNCLATKWGTPDVIGVYRASKRDLIKFQPEIVSAEIKISPAETITAFGQAVAYRLFSTKVYIVVPNTMSAADQDRLVALCILFGIGFILFELKPKKPNFQIRVRAQRNTPDMFYANKVAEGLYKADIHTFNVLF